jgi:hypothetical protein
VITGIQTGPITIFKSTTGGRYMNFPVGVNPNVPFVKLDYNVSITTFDGVGIARMRVQSVPTPGGARGVRRPPLTVDRVGRQTEESTIGTDILVATFTDPSFNAANPGLRIKIQWLNGSSALDGMQIDGVLENVANQLVIRAGGQTLVTVSQTGRMVRGLPEFQIRANHVFAGFGSFFAVVQVTSRFGFPAPAVCTEVLVGSGSLLRLGQITQDVFGAAGSTRLLGKIALAEGNDPASQARRIRATMSTTEFMIGTIRRLYFEILGRDPVLTTGARDPRTGLATPVLNAAGEFQLVDQGARGWVQFLSQIGTEKQLRALLIASDEYFIKAQSNLGTFLDNMYRNLLGRTISNDPGGLATWSQHLARGMTRFQCAMAVMDSEEGLRQMLSDFYFQLLFRDRVPPQPDIERVLSRDPNDPSQFVLMTIANKGTPNATSVDRRVKNNVDAEGLRAHLPALRQNRIVEVLLSIYLSDEFLARSGQSGARPAGC